MQNSTRLWCLFTLALLLNSSLFSQTKYTFTSASGAGNNAGHRTTTTSPSEAYLEVSNNMLYTPNLLYTATSGSDPLTFTIKGDGVNVGSFDVTDMEWGNYNGSSSTFDASVTQIVFTKKNLTTVTWSSISPAYQVPTSFTDDYHSILNIFTGTSTVTEVTQIEITVDLGDDAIYNFEVRNITLANLTAPNNTPSIGGTVANQAVNDNATISPFSSITTTDTDNDNLTATITLDDNTKGVITGANAGKGPYSMTSKSPGDMQTALRALVFNPTDNRTSTTETTTFTVVIDDGADDATNNSTTVISSAVGPDITAVSIPNATMKIGDIVTATITVSTDADDYTAGSGSLSGTIGGFTLANLSKTNNTTYTATFTVTEGGTDVVAGSTIPTSLALTDSGGKEGNTFTTAINQNADAIDANTPTAPSAPDLEIGSDTGSSATDNISTDTTPTFTGTAEANSTVTFTSSVDGVLGTTTADVAGDWSFTSAVLTSNTSHNITITATDAAGNTSSASSALNITLDSAAPDAPDAPDLDAGSDTGSSATDNITTDTTPTFTGTAEANSTVIVTSSIEGALGIATTDSAGDWSFTSAVLTSNTSHNITITASDTAGNTSSASVALSITLDSAAPDAPNEPDLDAGSDTGSSATDNITTDTTPTFNGTAEANSTVIITSSVEGDLGTAATDGAGDWSFTSAVLTSNTSRNITITATDVAGNTSSASSALSITLDSNNPTFSSSSPMDNAASVSADGNITVTFNEDINFGTGNIQVIDVTDGSNSFTIDAASPGVEASVSNAVLTINPGSDLDETTNYAIQIAATAISDIAGNSYAGITDNTTLDFTTADVTAPTLQNSSPVDGATNCYLLQNITLTFDDTMAVGTGNITIVETGVGNFEQLDVTNATLVGVSGKTVTLNPSGTLKKGTDYHILIDATALKNASNYSFEGISDATTLNFSTVDVVINEVVTEAQTDWSSTSFNGVNGGGTISADDEWVELYIKTAAIDLSTGWMITVTATNFSGSLNAAGAFDNSNYFGVGARHSTAAGDYLILGNPAGSNDISNGATISLIDPSGAVVDAVTLGGGFAEAPDGGTNTIGDESIQRMPNGTDTDTHNEDFKHGIPSLGTANINAVSWSGATNTDWATASNWATNALPLSTDNVVIPNVPQKPVISAGTSAVTNDITINSSTSLIINSGGSLTVEGNLTQNGLFSINSDATSNGSLIIKGLHLGAGKIEYKRYFTASAEVNKGWHLISTPLDGKLITDFYPSVATIGDRLGIEYYNNTNDPGTKWVKYSPIENAGAFIRSKGYAIKPAMTGTLSFNGYLNATDVSIDIYAFGDQFNCIGNPYTSYLNSGAFLDNVAPDILTENTIWLWDEAANGGEGEYIAKNKVHGYKIAPGQAFFVQAAVSGDVSFAESSQTHIRENLIFSPQIRLAITDGSNVKSTEIFYIENKTTGFDDGYDSSMFNSYDSPNGVSNNLAIYTQLASDNEGKNLAIQTLPNSDYDNIVVPIGIRADVNTKITFTAEALNLPASLKVILEDRLVNKFILLDEDNDYEVQLTEAQNGVGRFFLMGTGDNVTPSVTAVSVPTNATYINGQNLDFNIEFSENVTVNTIEGTPQLAITIGATTRQALYQSGSGSSTLVFRYTVQAGDLDTDGITIGTLDANGGTFKDNASNNSNLTLNSVGSTIGVLVGAAVNSPYLWGVDALVDVANAEFQNNFIETGTAGSYDVYNWTALSVNDHGGNTTPGLAYWKRNLLGYSQGAYSSTTLVNSPTQSNGVAIFDSDFMDNGGATEAYGTGISPAPHKGELISPRINLTGNTDVPLAVKFYSYFRNFNIRELSVSFSSDDGATWGNPIDYINGVISESYSNQGFVTTTLPSNSTQGVSDLTKCRIKFTFDGEYYFAIIDDVTITVAPPKVTSVTVPADATYIVNQNLDFTINFNENIIVNTTEGTPQLAITIGATTRQATYQSGSGTDALVFRYIIQSDEVDTDGIAVGTLAANGGTLRNAASNNADLTLNSVGTTTGVLVDAAPTVTVFSPADNATSITPSDNLVITFSENMVKGTGVILIKDAADDSIVHTIDVTSTSVIIADAVITINPSTDLLYGKNYYIQIAATAFKDGADNNYAGIEDKTTFNFSTLPVRPNANNILYVNKNISGSNGKGDSWANAITELADAMVWAQENYDAAWETTPLQIYVAKGTYKPMFSPEDGVNFGTNQGRNNSFLMIKNVQLYGGFDPANGIDDLTDTRILSSLGEIGAGTVLSGDIGTENDTSDNTYNVVISSGEMGTASLDGFSLTKGNANNYLDINVNGNQVYKCSGAGIYNSVSSPSYKNLMLYSNSCTESGGGMFSYKSSPKLELVILKNNEAKDGGGMTNQQNSSPTLLNVSIQSNQASESGSGMYNVDLSGPTLTNVSIVGNEASVSSEEVPECVSENSTITLNNSIIWDVVSGDYTAQNSLIKGNSDTSNGNIDATGITDTNIFTDPANGDYSLKNTSPAVNTGSNSLYTNAGGDIANDVDLAGNSRLYDGAPTTDIIDMGAYEYLDNINPVFTSASTANFTEGETGTVYTVAATDDSTITYSLGTDNDEALFDLVGGTGVVTFKSVPDFENPTDGDTNNTYIINVIASDGANSVNQDVTITVIDVDEIVPTGYSIAIDQTKIDAGNSSSLRFTFAGAEVGATYDYTITSSGGGTDVTGTGTIATATDQISLIDVNGLEDGTLTLSVTLTDAANNEGSSITDTVVKDVSSGTVDFEWEGFFVNQQDLSVTSRNFGNFSFTSSLGNVWGTNSSGESDSQAFHIPDLATIVTIESLDGREYGFESFYNAAFSGLAITKIEGFKDGLSTGVDTRDFSTNGIVNMGSIFNDVDKIVITGSPRLLITLDNFEFEIPDFIAPIFSSATSTDYEENGTGTAYTALASDASTLTYGLGSGNDEALFDIVEATGIVTFKTVPDFESPEDADIDNEYIINVIVSDDTNSANQNVTISVTDVDEIKPTVTVTSASISPANEVFTTTFTFSEEVTGFDLTDVTVGNGTASEFTSVSPKVYRVTVTPTLDGTVTVDVGSGVARDIAGNTNVASERYSVLYDATNPTATISTTASDPVNTAFTVDIRFDEDVFGFELSDLVVTNGTASNFLSVGPAVYSVVIAPMGSGRVLVDILAGFAEDRATNPNDAAGFEISYDNVLPIAPVITHISDYTCTGNVNMTGDNTLELSGTAEEGSEVELFQDGVSIGATTTDDTGTFTFDYTATTLSDGTYGFTAIATDLSNNISGVSSTLTLTIDSMDTDRDGLPDFCDDDDDGNGVVDVEEDCDGDGIVDHLDSDIGSCGNSILSTKSYGFSPNGDGINEGWYVENITAYPDNVVQVFNRSGKLVFTRKGYRNEWEGISNQTRENGSHGKLPAGPYLYIIDLGDGSRPAQGWLYINY